MRRVGAIAWTNLVRLFRDRANFFFVLVLPVLVIGGLSLQFGGEDLPRVGLAGRGEIADRAAEQLAAGGGMQVQRVDGADELRALVRDGDLAAGVALPDGAEDTLRHGEQAAVAMYVGSPDAAGALADAMTQALDAEALVASVTGQLAAASGVPPADVAAVVEGTASALQPVEVVRADGATAGEDGPGVTGIAIGIIVLFTFLNTLTGATLLIQSRRLHVSTRMVASPTPLTAIVLGEAAGRWATGMFQAAYVVLATILLFGAEWGHLPSTLALLALFAGVAAGGAMLVGAIMDNDAPAAGVTVMVGLGLGALGGAMLPLDLFNSTMRTVAYVTPHAWAVDALTQLSRQGGTLLDVLPAVAALTGFGLVLFALATWRLRAALTRPS